MLCSYCTAISAVKYYISIRNDFQKNTPCPRLEYAEYSFVKEIAINRYDSKTGEEIAKLLTGLMNTSGGLVVLYCNTQDWDKRDSWLRQLHNAITTKWMPRSKYGSLVRHKYWMQDGQLRIYMFVTKSKDVITFECNAYLRYATSTEAVTNNDEVRTLLDAREHPNKVECKSQMEQLLRERESFTLDESIPVDYEESQQIEFKHYHKHNEDLTFTAKDLMDKLDDRKELLKNVSAFANTCGGSLILGVMENKRGGCTVRGFPAGENTEQEKEEFIKDLDKKINSCTFVGKSETSRLVRGSDWDVFFYDVIPRDGALRVLVEIRVGKHNNGLFLKTPTCFVVDSSGELGEIETLEEWGNLILASPRTSDYDRGSRTSQVQKHVEELTQASDDVSNGQQEVQIQHPAEEGNSSQTQTSRTADSDKKRRRYFDGRDTDIKTYGLKQLDCCMRNMAHNIHDMEKQQNHWYPSSEAIKKRGPQYRNLINYVNEKQWPGIVTVIDTTATEERACHHSCGIDTCPGILFYTLIISTKVRPKLLCCFDTKYSVENQEQTDKSHIKCALHLGRKLKKEFLNLGPNKNQHSAPFYFEVLVLSVPSTETGAVIAVWDSEDENNKPVSYPYADCQTQFNIACYGLSEKLLNTRSQVKDRYGDFFINHLTDEQAKVLLDRDERILVVKGGSGTGKTVIAIHLLKNAVDNRICKETEILYICSSEGLKAFIHYQMEPVKCEVWVMTATNALSDMSDDGAKATKLKILRNTKLVIVDDVHAISLSETWNKEDTDDLYPALFKHAAENKADVAVFFDPDQAYKQTFPEDFDEQLRTLAESIAQNSDGRMAIQDIKRHELKERIRNSQQIIRFMQANQNQANVGVKLECLNEMEGDGVTYEFIGDNYEENARRLDAKLSALLKVYEKRSIVVLFDDDTQLTELNKLSKTKYNWKVRDGKTFPSQDIVMCRLDDFGGLESEVVIFVLPPAFGREDLSVCYWKYMNVISSRAKQKLEFLVPWDPDKDATRMQKLLGLLQVVSITLKILVACNLHNRIAGRKYYISYIYVENV